MIDIQPLLPGLSGNWPMVIAMFLIALFRDYLKISKSPALPVDPTNPASPATPANPLAPLLPTSPVVDRPLLNLLEQLIAKRLDQMGVPKMPSFGAQTQPVQLESTVSNPIESFRAAKANLEVEREKAYQLWLKADELTKPVK